MSFADELWDDAAIDGRCAAMDNLLTLFIIRSHVLGVAERLEKELGEEQHCFIAGCSRDWAKLSPVGIILFVFDNMASMRC
jgi:hypothetical protein